MKHEIWSNINLDFDDWKETLLEDATNMGLPTDDESLYQMMVERNDEFLDDERANLNKDAGGQLVCLFDLGRWDGRHRGFRYMETRNIADCLRLMDGCEEARFYVENGDLKAVMNHHDGTNYYIFRALRDNHKVEDAIFVASIEGGKDPLTFAYCESTKPLGDKIAAVYGWED